MINKVVICGINTSDLKVIPSKEQIELLIKVKQGDKAAREKIINGNLKLVLSVVQRFSSRGENPDDLFQVGCIGLIKSIDNFDINQDVKFSTYAVPMIIGEIRRYLRDNNSIRVSRSMRDTAYKALSAKEELMRDSNREPTIEEIAAKLNLPREDVVIAMEAIVEPISLYEPVYNDETDSVYVLDQVRDKNSSDSNWIEEISLKQAIKHLSDRERNILSLRFFKGKTQVEVAQEIGISQAQVSRLEKSALRQIKKHL